MLPQRFHSGLRVAPACSHEWEHDVGYDLTGARSGAVLPSRSARDSRPCWSSNKFGCTAPLIKRRIPFADAPCVKQLTPGTQDPKALRADGRTVGNGKKVAADPFCLIHVDRSTNDAIHYDRVACLAPAQNFYSERLTITHGPHDQPAETRPAGDAKARIPRRPEPIGSQCHCRGPVRCPA
jgi:hypothetical protein